MTMTTQPQQQQGQEASDGMQMLIARAISDPEFRNLLIENPEQALQSGGFDLSVEERRVITGTSRQEREDMLCQLSERTSPAVCTFWSLYWVRLCIWGAWWYV